jgi:exopolysaccharide production protein ExoY
MGSASNRGAFLIFLSKYGSWAGKSLFPSEPVKAERFGVPFTLRRTGAVDRIGPVGGLAKRCFDVAGALTALVLMAPAMLLISAAIYLTMGRPIFLVERKIGYAGIPFGGLTFRTTTSAEGRLDAANGSRVRQRQEPGSDWLGRILRRSGLDELPQLFNVLAGHMSCVGPSPLSPSELERHGSHDRIYLAAKPGLTGLRQITEPTPPHARRDLCDRYYVNRWSLGLDFAILARTMREVLK